MKDYLAEDYVIGKAIGERLGKRVAVASGQVLNVSQNKSAGDFLKRYVRWSIIHRTAVEPVTYFAQALLNPLPIALLALLLHPAGWTLAVAAGVMLAKIALDLATVRAFRPRTLGWSALAAIPVKDLLLFGAWVNGLFRSTVNWRGNQLRVTTGSRLVPAGALEVEGDLEEAEETELAA
jgi:ceramide glucosyltransferase